MARFQIISKDGKSVRYEGKPKYVGTYMKPSYLEFSEISSPTPINWEIGDYVDYSRTGMRYRLYSIPQASKNAKRDSFGSAFTYSNVQLFAATKELEIAPFRDLVADDNFIHFSTSPDVATFEDIHGIAGRIQACMDDLYPGRWEIKTVETSSESDLGQMLSTAKDFALSGGTCLDALSKIYELWQEVGWIHSYDSASGKEVITIGYANTRIADNTTDPYLYGKGKGLTAIKKNHTNKDEFATRLYVYGSERNLPTRYYNDKAIANAESVDIRNLMLPIREWGTTNNLPDARKAYLENAEAVAKYGVIPRTHYFDSDDAGADIYPSIGGVTIGEVRDYVASGGEDKNSPDSAIYSDSERVDEIKYAAFPGDDGIINKDGKPYDEIYYVAIKEEWIRTDIAVGDNSKTLNACLFASAAFKTKQGKITFRSHEGVSGFIVDNSQISKATLVFELTDSTTKTKQHSKEYTLELSEVKDGARKFTLPYQMDMAYTSDSEVTIYAQIYIKVEFKEAVKSEFFIEYYIGASDCTLEAKADITKVFHLTLKQIGFDLNERASLGGKKALSMKSGMCEGRTFNILGCRYDSQSDSWELECARQQDDTLGILFPNTNNHLASGDRFVLLNIAMPEAYIYAAMEKLLKEGEKLLARASKYQCNYEPQIDAKVMQESEDEANRPGSDSKPRLLREGMYMEISDQDVIDGETDYILIDSLNIYEDESPIPTYKVTLREKRKVSYKGTPSATSPTSTKSADDSELDIDLSEYATKAYVRDILGDVGVGEVILDDAMSDTSDNGVKNKVIKAYVDEAKQDAIDASASYTVESINGMKEYWFDDEMSDDSYRGVKNYVIKKYVDGKFDEASAVYDWLEFDSEEQAVKVKFPLYSVSSITAGGKKDESGDGPASGGLDYDALEDYLSTYEYATQPWVNDQGFAMDDDLKALSDKVDSIDTSVYVTEDWVKGQGYVDEQWVNNQGYATNTALNELSDKVDSIDTSVYVTEDWVKEQGYVTTDTLNSSISELDTRLTALEKLLDWFEFDETAQMIKAKFGLYSEGAITAGKKAEEE